MKLISPLPKTIDHVDAYWGDAVQRTIKHFYHVGSTEDLRNEMEEVLVIREGYEVAHQSIDRRESLQISLLSDKSGMIGFYALAGSLAGTA